MTQRLTFRQKLTGVTMLASALALVLTFATLLPLRRAELVEDEKTNLESLAQVVGDSSKAALSFRDERVGREALAGLAAKPQIVAAAIYTADGREWLVYRGPGGPSEPLPPRPGPNGFLIAGDTATVFHPVTMDGERLGTVYLRANISRLAARGRSYALTLLLIMVVCAAAAFGLANKLQAALSRPIEGLVAAARRVSKERDYSLRVPPSGSRELQELALAFNGMLARIEEQDADLRAARDGLEERVRERVADVRREVTERAAHAEGPRGKRTTLPLDRGDHQRMDLVDGRGRDERIQQPGRGADPRLDARGAAGTQPERAHARRGPSGGHQPDPGGHRVRYRMERPPPALPPQERHLSVAPEQRRARLRRARTGARVPGLRP